MKLIDINSEQRRRRRPTTMDVLSAQDGLYSILEEGAGLALELENLTTAFCEAFLALLDTRCEPPDTIEW